MRYVLIRDDADVATIDEALRILRTRRLATVLPVVRVWITDEINELLEQRLRAVG